MAADTPPIIHKPLKAGSRTASGALQGPLRQQGGRKDRTPLIDPASQHPTLSFKIKVKPLRRSPTRNTPPMALKRSGRHARQTWVAVDANLPYALVPLAAGSATASAHPDGLLLVNPPRSPTQARAVEQALQSLRGAIAAQQGLARPDARPAGPAQALVDQLRESLAADAATPPARTPEQVRQGWVDAGLLIGSEALARAWTRKRQALEQMAARGDLLGIKHKNRLWYPAGYRDLAASDVAALCQAIGAGQPGRDAVAQLMFLLQPQPADNHQTVLQLWGGNRDRANQHVQDFLQQQQQPQQHLRQLQPPAVQD